MNGYAAGGGMRPFLLGAAGGAAVGGGVAYALLRRDRGSAAVEGKTPPGETVHPAMRLGWPTGTEDLLRVRDGFVASYDARTRNPRWVLEVLNTSTMSGPGTRKRSNFVEDATLDERFRAKLADFRGSGYDRGHLAAAAGHKNSQRAMDETFELCNISPQVGDGFNRDYWARLERFTRDVALRTKLDVLVATGPLFLPTRASQSELRARDLDAAVSSSAITAPDVSVPNSTPAVSSTDITAAAARPSTAWEMRYPLIGSPPELVAVPTHFYKVVVAAAPEGSDHSRRHAVAAAAFVVPNAPVPPDTPLERFVVPLAELESASGLRFFRGEGALGGSGGDAFAVAEGRYFDSRRGASTHGEIEGVEGGKVKGGGGGAEGRAVARRLERTTHVCRLVRCELPKGWGE